MKTAKHSALDAVARLVVLLMALLFFTVLARLFTRQVLVGRLGMDNAFTRAVMFDAKYLNLPAPKGFDWKSLYPFEGTEPKAPGGAKPAGLRGAVRKAEALVDAGKQALSRYTANYLVFYRRFAEAANFLEKAAGWSLRPDTEYNAVIPLADGTLTTTVRKRETAENAVAVAALAEDCAALGTGLVYVQLPYKTPPGMAGVSGIFDFSNENADGFLAQLKGYGVETLDLRAAIRDAGMDHLSLFYRTDHHWKAETGLWAAAYLGRYLNASRGYGIDPAVLEPGNYRLDTYEGWFLGSQGKKVTLSRSRPEDISLIYPAFDTRLSFTLPDLGLSLKGDFSIVYDMSHLREKDFYSYNPFAAYMYADHGLALFENPEARDGHSVLLIGDSYDNAMAPFMALGVRRLDSLDLRHFNGSLQTLLKKNRYDLVMFAYNPNVLGDMDNQGANRMFDFR